MPIEPAFEIAKSGSSRLIAPLAGALFLRECGTYAELWFRDGARRTYVMHMNPGCNNLGTGNVALVTRQVSTDHDNQQPVGGQRCQDCYHGYDASTYAD